MAEARMSIEAEEKEEKFEELLQAAEGKDRCEFMDTLCDLGEKDRRVNEEARERVEAENYELIDKIIQLEMKAKKLKQENDELKNRLEMEVEEFKKENYTLKKEVYELEEKCQRNRTRVDYYLFYASIGLIRRVIEGKEEIVCDGNTEPPPMVHALANSLSQIDPLSEHVKFINPTASKLYSLLRKYYLGQLSKKANNTPQITFKKHFKIWLYAILFCRQKEAYELRKQLLEPQNPEDNEAMLKYLTKVITFCSNIQAFFTGLPEGIFNPLDEIPKDEVLKQIARKSPGLDLKQWF